MRLVSDQWFVFGMDFFNLRRLWISKKESSKSLSILNSVSAQTLISIDRQKNIDYAICKALNSKTMKGIDRSLLVYDVFCQWIINFLARVDQSPFLSIPEGLQIVGAIGDFHVGGHVDDCLPRYTLAYVPGSGVIDGEILETLWAVLNETSRSAKGATMAHRNEILDDHMNHSNWKKLIGMRKYKYLIKVRLHLILTFL
jgi:Kyakuja-Dileera-Zisupton transposase